MGIILKVTLDKVVNFLMRFMSFLVGYIYTFLYVAIYRLLTKYVACKFKWGGRYPFIIFSETYFGAYVSRTFLIIPNHIIRRLGFYS